MSELLLSDEEITEANRIPPEEYRAEPNWWLRVSRKVARAQLKKLVRELFEPCYGTESYYLAPKGYHRFDIKDDKWQALQEACGD